MYCLTVPVGWEFEAAQLSSGSGFLMRLPLRYEPELQASQMVSGSGGAASRDIHPTADKLELVVGGKPQLSLWASQQFLTCSHNKATSFPQSGTSRE